MATVTVIAMVTATGDGSVIEKSIAIDAAAAGDDIVARDDTCAYYVAMVADSG